MFYYLSINDLLFRYTLLAPTYFIPTSITHLTFRLALFSRRETNDFMQFVIPNLPTSLIYLAFIGTVNQLGFVFNLPLPPKLIHLELCQYTSATFSNYSIIPHSLKHFSFGFTVYTLPSSFPPQLTHLTFGYYFNQIICNNSLPQSLKYLELGCSFNQAVDSLPHLLTHLILSRDFNQPIDHLPPNLYHLEIKGDGKFNHPIDSLPHSLATLIITSFKFNQPTSTLPPYLSRLEVFVQHNRYESPTHFHQVQKNICYSVNSARNTQFSFASCPSTIQTLVLYTTGNLPPLSPIITRLVLGDSFNETLPSLPVSLITLILGLQYDQPLIPLPLHLNELAIRFYGFSHSFSIPRYLSSLCIGILIINLPTRNTEVMVTRKKDILSRFEERWQIIM